LPYCPRCKYEYPQTDLLCPDCNEVLVDELIPKRAAAMTPDSSWVVVGGVADQVEVMTAKSSLDSSNIPSMVTPSGFGDVERVPSTGNRAKRPENEGSLIMVPREYQEEAILLLGSILGDDFIDKEAP
jgi:hypothetical protein